MKFIELLTIVGDESVFSPTLLLTNSANPPDIYRQISRWVSAGKLIQLRRSLYMVATPYRKQNVHPFLIANRMKNASYVSLQSALAFYGLIPEAVPVVTSVTTGRPEKCNNAAGFFLYKHLKKELFSNYRYTELVEGNSVFIATPEKALLDLIYLTPDADSMEYLSGLRIQNPDRIEIALLTDIAFASGSRKLIRAAERLSNVLITDEYDVL